MKTREHVAEREAVVGVLEDASVSALQDVGEVRAPVGPDSADVGVQPGLPASVTDPSRELGEQLTLGEGLGLALLLAHVQPGFAPDVLEVGAHRVAVDRGAGNQEHRWSRAVHRGGRMLANRADERRTTYTRERA